MKQRLLVFSPMNFIPPVDGGRQGIYFRYKYLAQEFDIDLILIGIQPDEVIDRKEYSKFFRSVYVYSSDLQPSQVFRFKIVIKKLYTFLLGKAPFFISRSAPMKYKDEIQKIIYCNDYDLILLEDLFGSNILMRIERKILSKCLCVIHSDPSRQRLELFRSKNLFQLIYKYSEFFKAVSFEKKIIPKLRTVICISYDDAEQIKSRYKAHKRITYFPSVLEFQSYKRKENYYIKNCSKLTFIAPQNSLNNEALDWFMEEVFPRIESDVEICLVGSICDYYHKRYEPKSHIKLFGFCENERKIELLLQSDIFINPIKHGTGVKIKNIEAMSLGLPIITTSIGVYGLERDWKGSLIAVDTPEHFANAIDSLISSEDKRKELGENAFRYFSNHFSPESSIKKWKNLIESAIS